MVEKCISENELRGNVKLRMPRECAIFLYGICPHPSPTEYIEMAKSICDKYPMLKDVNPRNGQYWVNCVVLYLYRKKLHSHETMYYNLQS